jgi:hypothetical protein
MMSDLDSERGSNASQICTANLTEDQQRLLEPRLRKLNVLFKFGASCCCCTACLSLIPYWLYSRRVVRLIKHYEEQNMSPSDENNSVLSIESGDPVV